MHFSTQARPHLRKLRTRLKGLPIQLLQPRRTFQDPHPSTERQESTSLFSNLPNEILLLVFENLDDLDDVLHLERTCRRLHDLLDLGRNRVIVFRSVILRASHHIYDVQLCYFLEQNQRFTTRYFERDDGVLESNRPPTSRFMEIYNLLPTKDTLPDEFVWWIACRWQGLRVFQDLYLHPPIYKSYCSDFPSFWRSDKYKAIREIVVAEGPLARPSRIVPVSDSDEARNTLFGPKQTQRLYKALTAIWFDIEAYYLARVTLFSTIEENATVLEILLDIWGRTSSKGLSATFDKMEVYEFVWGFLGKSIFDYARDTRHCPASIRCWITALVDQDYPSGQAPGTLLPRAQIPLTYFTPPNILEAYALSIRDRSWPLTKPHYLRQLSRIDILNDIILKEGEARPLWHYEGAEIGLAIGTAASALDSPDSRQSLRTMLEKYREKGWDYDARGKIFGWEEDDDWVVQRIKSLKHVERPERSLMKLL